MSASADAIPRYAQPEDRAPERTCGDCVFCRGAAEVICLWDVVRAVLDGTDADDADVRLVSVGDEGCLHWRRSKWA